MNTKLIRVRWQRWRRIRLMEKRTREFHAAADTINRMTDLIKEEQQGSRLNCRACGLTLIDAPVHIGKGITILAKWVVPENIIGPVPQAGDAYELTCRCGKRIISLTPEYIISEKKDKFVCT